ncbi:hypothetical protein KEJ47_09660 [Candidatus Bathyarchaeota archaeon]|nr:hypothetical protein [Candidatus Bathyarchaeota archaeon]
MSKNWEQWEDLPPDEEDRLIEELAKKIVDHRAGLIAEIILDSGGPLTKMFAELWMGLYGPYLDFIGADRYMALLRKRSNIERLKKRIDELDKEKEKMKKIPNQA